MNPWKRLGLQIHLAQDENEQKFVNSLATYSSSWLRIKFDNDEVKTDDQFQGNTGCFLLVTKILLRNYRFWRLDWGTIFECQSKTSISNQFSRIILARIGSRLISPGRIVHFRDTFSFWAKMIIVFMTSCDDSCENFLTQNQEHEFLLSDKHWHYVYL